MKRKSFLFRRVVFCSLLIIRSLPALSIALFGFATTLAFGQSTGSPPNQLPPETKPVIPPGDDVIIYVHGGPGSRLEEASDLVKPLLEAGRNRGKGYTLISFDQPSQGYSSMVDPLRLVPGVLRQTQPPPDQVEIPFPISASQHNDFRNYIPGGAAHMDTAVGISKNGDGSGTLTAATHIWDTSDGVGFHGAVAVALLDDKNQLLWVSATQNRGVTCKVKFVCGTGKNFVPDQNFNWDPETVPAQVMQSFRHIAIMQRWNPRKFDDDIRAFLHNVGDFFAEVKPFLQNLPTAISHTVAGGNDSTIYYPLVAASDEFISGFLTELSRVTDLSNRNIYVMGGSTGGAVTLGMGHSSDPRIKKIVAWNPASVWTSYIDDPNPVDRAAKSIALTTGFERSQTPITLDQREAFFNGVFGEPVNGVVQPNPEEWYRGDRDKYPGNQGPFRGEWACKWDYISASRLEMEEVYNPAYDHWHWRLGTEVLAFSFFNDNWAGPAHDASGRPNANYMGITKPTLLVAGDDDDWAMGPGLHLENRWSQTRKMAAMMKNTPGKTLFLTNTGHSIHNERPNLFAEHIVDFLLGPVPGRGPLQVLADFQPLEGPNDKDKDCAHVFSPPAQFPSIPPQLLENPAAADALMQLASRRGKINGLDPGRYSMRLNQRLRAVAQRKDPKVALGAAAERFYNGDPVFGKAYADLAVTGRNVYEAFRKHQPTDEEVAAEAASILVPPGRLAPPPDRARLLKAVHDAKTRAYEVAWALRNPDPQAGFNSRKDPSLGWIAVSGEDDPPARPVNVPSGLPIYAADGKTQVSAYPQYEITVALCPNSSTPPYVPHYCPAGTQASVPFQIRYTMASLSQRKPGGGPIITGVSLPQGPITGGTLLHVGLAHGSASNASVTLGSAIPPQARCDGENCWFTTPANAKPGPLNIVLAAERTSAIVPRVSSKPSPFTYTRNVELAAFEHDSSSTDPARYLMPRLGSSQATSAANDPQAVRFALAHQHSMVGWCFGYLYVSPTAISYVETTPAKDQGHSFSFQLSQITTLGRWNYGQQNLNAVELKFGKPTYHFWWMPNEQLVQTGRPYQWNPPDAADPQQLIDMIRKWLPVSQVASASSNPGPPAAAPNAGDPLASSAVGAVGGTGNQLAPGSVGGRIGLSLGNLTPAKSQSLGLSATTGALVEQLDSNGSAAKAGVRVDDVIITLNGAPIIKALDVRTALRHLAPGSTAELNILRQGQPIKITVKVRQ